VEYLREVRKVAVAPVKKEWWDIKAFLDIF